MSIPILVLIITFSLILIGLSAYEFIFIKKMKKWPNVQCDFVTKEIQKRNEMAMYARIYRCYPHVEYTYSIDGKTYKSNHVSIHKGGEWSYDEKEAQNLLDLVSNLKSAKVNPKNNKESYLLDYLLPKSLSHFKALLASGIILITISITLWIVI